MCERVGCHYKCELLSEKYTDLLNRANVMLDKYKTDLNNKTILNKRAGEVEQDLHGLKLLCKYLFSIEEKWNCNESS